MKKWKERTAQEKSRIYLLIAVPFALFVIWFAVDGLWWGAASWAVLTLLAYVGSRITRGGEARAARGAPRHICCGFRGSSQRFVECL